MVTPNKMTNGTLVVTDLVDSTRITEEIGDERAAEIFSKHDALARDLLQRFEGQEVDRTDGFLLTFERPIMAVRFAIEFHRMLARLSDEESVSVAARVGIHFGEYSLVERSGEEARKAAKKREIDGLAKPLTARITSLGLGGQTLLSSTAYELARRGSVGHEDVQRLEWRAHGPYALKGVTDPVEIFEVGIKGEAPMIAPLDTAKGQRLDEGETVTGWRPSSGDEIPGRRGWFLQRRLGEGSFGESWLAVNKSGTLRNFKFCFDRDRLKRFKREVQLFSILKEELGDRDDIVSLIDWSFDEEPFYIESEYASGGNLREWIEEKGGIDAVEPSVRIEIVAQIAETLGAAHDVRCIHNDVKPENILISESPKLQARLADFGIGQFKTHGQVDDAAAAAQRGGLDEEVGTTNPIYRAPELIEGKSPTQRADVYALGVVLYQLMTGKFTETVVGREEDIGDEFLREDIRAATRRIADRISATELAKSLRNLNQRREDAAKVARDAESSRIQGRIFWTSIGSLVVLLIISGFLIYHNKELSRREDEASQQRSEALNAKRTSGQLLDFLSNVLVSVDPEEARAPIDILIEAESEIAKLQDAPDIQAGLQELFGYIFAKWLYFEDAIKHLEGALANRKVIYGEGSPRLISAYHNLIEAHLMVDHRDGAQRYLDIVMSILESPQGKAYASSDDGKVDAVMTEWYRARLLYNEGRYSEQERMLREEVLPVQRELLSPDDPRIADTLVELAIIEHKMGNYQESKQLYEDARDVWFVFWETPIMEFHKSGPTSLHYRFAGLLNNYAIVEMDLGHYKEAVGYLDSALASYKAVFGDVDNPDTAKIYSNRGWVNERMGNLSFAFDQYSAAISMKENSLESPHWLLGQDYCMRGHLRGVLGQIEEGRKEVKRGVEDIRAFYEIESDDHPDLVPCLDGDIELAFMVGDLEGLGERIPQVRQYLEKTFGKDHELVAKSFEQEARYKLAKAIDDGNVLSSGPEARALLDRSLEVVSRRLGADHPRAAEILSYKGSLLAAMGESDMAMSNLETARKIWQESAAAGHPNAGRNLHLLANRKREVPIEAQEYYAEGYRIMTKALGFDHSGSRAICGDYNDFLQKTNRRRTDCSELLDHESLDEVSK